MPERVCIPAEASRLSARHAHMAGDGRTLVAAIDDEVVPLGLAADRLVNRSHEQVVGLRRTQWFAQIGRVFLAETHIKRAGAGHPYAIAGFAEIMRQRSNETEAAAGFRNTHVACRTASPIIDLLEPIALGKPRAHDR